MAISLVQIYIARNLFLAYMLQVGMKNCEYLHGSYYSVGNKMESENSMNSLRHNNKRSMNDSLKCLQKESVSSALVKWRLQ